MSYVIRRTDGAGGYVAQPGSRGSYTHRLIEARKYASREAAERDLCRENEVVIELERILDQVRRVAP